MKLPLFSLLTLAVGASLAMGADAPRAAGGMGPDATGGVGPQRALDAGIQATVSKGTTKPTPWVKLDIEAPRYRPTLPYGIEFVSGWSLVIHAAGSPQALGIATNALPVQFPGIDQTGYLILQDPDACLELPPPFLRGAPPCSEAPPDETYVEFSPGTDQVGITDAAGNPGRMAALADPSVSGNPQYDGVGDPNNDFVLDDVEVPVGPDTGGSTSDGVGYGADDDLPGLVILSPYGPGLVLNADFTRPAVRTQRNLAGFLHSVAYELSDAAGSTSFDATLIVPTGLIAPVMKIDACVGTFTDGRCDGPSQYQIDGGPMRTTDAPTGPQALYPEILTTQPYYEVRAFLVSGVAPSILSDRNHDGQVTAADARAAGYNVISNEELVRVRQYSTDICTGVPLLDVVYADFDHNGHATSTFVCPAGPGQITRIPK